MREKSVLAAGHGDAQQMTGLFIKPTTPNEIDFYQWIVHRPSPLTPFVPLFMGTLVRNNIVHSSETNLKDLEPTIVLEDLCESFDMAAVMDVKLGSQLYDQYVSPEKRERLEKVSQTTTSGSLGFRIAGLTAIGPDGKRFYKGKEFGREADPSNIVDYLAAFYPKINDDDYIYSALHNQITQLEQLRAALIEEPLELHSASVLLMYEGDRDTMKRKIANLKAEEEGVSVTEEEVDEEDDGSIDLRDKNKLVDVRLIDFAHTVRAETPSEDVIRGIDELVKALKQLMKRRQ